MIYLPVFGALALAILIIMERVVLKGKKVTVRLFQTSAFLAIIIIMLPFIYFFWKLNIEALTPINLFVFSLVIIFSMIANFLTFYSVKSEKVSNLEPAKVLEPLFVILLALLFSFVITDGRYERSLHVLIPAIVAGLALVLSHIKKHHLSFNKFFIAAIGGSFFFALELVTSRLILDYYSPITFYFLRCCAIAFASLIIFRPNFTKLDKNITYKIFIIGILWFSYRIIIYYGYLNLGIIFTTLLIMLGPIFVYLFAYLFLKEKIQKRNVIAAIVIVLSVLYATLL